MNNITFINFIFCILLLMPGKLKAEKRQMEYLNRGVVAVETNNGVYLSWRFLGTDNPDIGFNIYNNGNLVNSQIITSSTNFLDKNGTANSVYNVVPVLRGIEDTTNIKAVHPWSNQYLNIELNRPEKGITEPNKYGSVGKDPKGTFPNGQAYNYSPNDCSVGDLDGDGEYEIIVKWDPSNSQDNSYYGITGKVYIDAYKLDGTHLWRIDLGKNIRAGAHYTQFLVYDFDGDGLSELVCKTAPGTIDGNGNYVIMNNDDPMADYRSLEYSQIKGSKMLGTVQNGPEYLTLFDGKTGEELNTITYNPLRGSSSWGDSYGNRSDRFLACVAYIDGIHPSAVMGRGYYTRTTLASYNVVNKKLVQNWFYDSGTTKGIGAYGQGNHNLSAGDVDDDGKDEIIYGSCAIDDNGTLLYSTGLGHGDAIHLSDMDPDNQGMEVWEVHEEKDASYGYELHDAATGSILWGTKTGDDNGRGMAGDIDVNYPGFEMWSSSAGGVFSCKGEQISSKKPSTNFRIYWDGDLQDELLDGNTISKWTGNGTKTLLSASGYSSCNSTKKTPNLSADIIGDWREELVLWSTSNPSQIRIYTTAIPTDYRLFTPMHDPVYRLAIAWQNVAYNQPPHLGFYIGDGLDEVVQPDISTVKFKHTSLAIKSLQKNNIKIFNSNGILNIKSDELIYSIGIYSITGQLIHINNAMRENSYEYQLPKCGFIYIVKVKSKSGIQTYKFINKI